MRIFILEDDIDRFPRYQIQDALASRGHSITIARNFDEAQKSFQPPYDLLLLDHDLGGEMGSFTGYDFVKWMVFKGPRQEDIPPDVILHSHNPVGRMNMRKLLEDYDHTVAEIPFGTSYVKILERL